MARKLFPDSTRLGRATRPSTPVTANSSKPINEVQEETVTATGGSRTLDYDGQVTSALAFDASAATITSALEALSNVGVGDVLVEQRESSSEVQTETITATGGTRTLTFSGQTTSALNFDATASQIQTALEALSNVNPGDISVSGSGPFVYTFSGQYANVNVPTITVNGGSLTGGTSTFATTSQNSYINAYTFKGALKNLNVPTLKVDTASLTGGTSTIKVVAPSFNEIIARDATREALRAKGMLRSSSLTSNDVEKFGQRKPKDIGDPDRIPGER